jgi:hypothetical protein
MCKVIMNKSEPGVFSIKSAPIKMIEKSVAWYKKVATVIYNGFSLIPEDKALIW